MILESLQPNGSFRFSKKPVVYPVAGFTDGTQITGTGKAPTGSPPAGQPSIPAASRSPKRHRWRRSTSTRSRRRRSSAAARRSRAAFDIAQQNTSSPPTWITANIQGDNSNGYTVRVYERRAGCEGGTIFNARPSS